MQGKWNMGEKWKDRLETLFGLAVMVVVGWLVWKLTQA